MLRHALGLSALAVAGAVVAIVGMGVHRAQPYIGVSLALAMTLSTAVFARTWKRFAGFTAYAGAWVALTILLAYWGGPGGNNIVFIDDALGSVWIYGGAIAIVAVATVPRTLLEGSNGVSKQA